MSEHPTGALATPIEHSVGVHDLQVVRREQVSARMVRLVLGGEAVRRLRPMAPDEHVKIVLPEPDGTLRRPWLDESGHVEWPRPFPPNREYTIRRHDLAKDEIWIDFVVHAGGLASDWACRVEPGTTVVVVGLRGGHRVPDDFAEHWLLADHTALPALARWIEDRPGHVRIRAAVQVPDAEDHQDLAVSGEVDLTWLHAADGPSALSEHMQQWNLPAGRVYLWAAGEAGVLKPIRLWARANGFARGTCDIAGYWRTARTRTASH